MDDISEIGGDEVHRSMVERPDHRLLFIGKVYTLLCMQVFVTVVIAGVTFYLRRISGSGPGVSDEYFARYTLPLLIGGFLYRHRKSPLLSMFLLMLFAINIALALGIACCCTGGWIIATAAAHTISAVCSLILVVYWGVQLGYDYRFAGPFVSIFLAMLLLFGAIQIFLLQEKISMAIYGCLAIVLSCYYIVYDTNNVFKHYRYEEYILVATFLYADVISVFLGFLSFLSIFNLL